MKQVDYMAVAPEAMKQITGRGAFLTVCLGDRLNTMTIGWATVGFIWRTPVLMVAVRTSRHTFGLMEEAPDFTVTIPRNTMAKELAFCGSRSGRDMDKLSACGLETVSGRRSASPIIRAAGLHYECGTVHRAPMDASRLDASHEGLYPAKDYHTLYFGEILDCYETW